MSSRLSESPSSLSTVTPGAMTSRDRSHAIETMKSMYHAAQQAEYLHLQAEAELLLQQLQTVAPTDSTILNEEPRRKQRGITESEKSELPILMELLIIATLLFDVVCYRGFVPMLAHRARKVPVRPKFSSPQLFLHLRTNSENLLRRYTFDHCYQLRQAIRRHRLHQKMNVILIYSYFQKLHLITSLYFQTYISNYLVHSSIKHRPSILRRKHHVVQQHRYIMALMYVLAHASTLRPKGRGINPVAIQRRADLPQSRVSVARVVNRKRFRGPDHASGLSRPARGNVVRVFVNLDDSAAVAIMSGDYPS